MESCPDAPPKGDPPKQNDTPKKVEEPFVPPKNYPKPPK